MEVENRLLGTARRQPRKRAEVAASSQLGTVEDMLNSVLKQLTEVPQGKQWVRGEQGDSTWDRAPCPRRGSLAVPCMTRYCHMF